MISDEAVEAAALGIVGIDSWPAQWAEDFRNQYRHIANRALTAAAPFIAAQAWEQGYGLGYSDHMWDKGHEPRARNPYRSGT